VQETTRKEGATPEQVDRLINALMNDGN